MKKSLVILTLLFITGCAGVSVQRYSKDMVYPSTSPASIVIFPEKPAGKALIELGEITVTGADTWGQVETIFRTKAAQMGADAVYVFSKQEESRQYVSPDDCYVHEEYYEPYHHFGSHRYHPHYYYPRGYYYCYGYRSAIETATFISAVGIAIKYANQAQ
jgi:hypothetical protein